MPSCRHDHAEWAATPPREARGNWPLAGFRHIEASQVVRAIDRKFYGQLPIHA